MHHDYKYVTKINDTLGWFIESNFEQLICHNGEPKLGLLVKCVSFDRLESKSSSSQTRCLHICVSFLIRAGLVVLNKYLFKVRKVQSSRVAFVAILTRRWKGFNLFHAMKHFQDSEENYWSPAESLHFKSTIFFPKVTVKRQKKIFKKKIE